MKAEKKKINLTMLSVFLVFGYALAGQTVFLEAANGSYASAPIPADGAVIPGDIDVDNIWTKLIFVPGATAVEHTGYFSDDYSEVAGRAQDANLGLPPYRTQPGWEYTFVVGHPQFPPAVDTLVRGMTYYWCVDETDALGTTYPGDVWEFTIQGFKAFAPNPPDGAVGIDTTVLLSWLSGFGVEEHDVYIGTVFNDVNNALYNPMNFPLEFLGTVTEPNIIVTGLSDNTWYYWRVDEISGRMPPPIGGGMYYKGDVWSFTTRPAVCGLFVDIDAAGENNGSSWADAFNHLQDALSIAWPGDEIHVAQGTYKPNLGVGITPGDRNATFQLISGVTIKGGYAGFGQPDPNARDISLYETILSGDLSGNDVEVADPCDLLTEPTRAENSYHVITGSETDANTVVDGFTITAGNANGSGSGINHGGGMFNNNGSPILTNCTFSGNSATAGGGVFNQDCARPTFVNCSFIGNSANIDGGAIFNIYFTRTTLINCIFSGNSAGNYGGAILWQYPPPPGGCPLTPGLIITNCILWANSDSSGSDESAQICSVLQPTISYSCIQGWTGDLGGTGNIGDDPLFVDADGIDNIVGTDDDNLRLLVGSPCIDAGDNSVVTVPTDLDGNPRIRGGAVDMGAYEACTIYHVDGISGDNTNDGLTRGTAFETIQRGINVAEDYDTVLVWPGVYNEEISFWGDAITVKSAADAAVVEINYGYAFSFFSAEGPDTVLSNFVIRNSQYGIYLINGSSPTLSNLTIVNNDFGISAYNGADPDISNCILWGNYYGDLFRDPVPLEAKYSWIEDEIETNPVSHWKFDEGSGTIAYDSVGTNDGTIYGAAWTTGKIGGALDFDGDDYVETSDDLSLRFTQYDSFSICSWAKPVEGSIYGGFIVCKMRASHQSGYFGYNTGLSTTSNKYFFTAEKSMSGSVTIGTGEASFGEWSHVTAVYDNKDMKIYLDGELEDTDTFNLNTGSTVPDKDLAIGARSVDSLIDIHFNGAIDDVRVYDKVLSDEEIQRIYQNLADPLFVDAAGGDYHLLSERGRYWPAHDVWVLDDVTSPCIDGGDPNVNPSNERMPNGRRINMGAYGNTAYASMSEWPFKHDSNFDGVVNMLDLAGLAMEWLEGDALPSPPPPPPPDTLPPLPDPMQWDPVADANGYDGRPREILLPPHGPFDYGATMRAIDAVDQAPLGVAPAEVEYYFECQDDGGFDSGWRTVALYPNELERRTYTVKIGGSGHAYIFRVKARDASDNLNETVWSDWYPAVYRLPP